jgi:hypothetical protein
MEMEESNFTVEQSGSTTSTRRSGSTSVTISLDMIKRYSYSVLCLSKTHTITGTLFLFLVSGRVVVGLLGVINPLEDLVKVVPVPRKVQTRIST